MGPTLLLLIALLPGQVQVGPPTPEQVAAAAREAQGGCFPVIVDGVVIDIACGPGGFPRVSARILRAPLPVTTGDEVAHRLEHLAAAQAEGGRWVAADGEDDPTVWVLQAFLEAGHTDVQGLHRSRVKAALRALLSAQRGDCDGRLAESPTEHVLAARALLKAHALTSKHSFKQALGLALPAILDGLAEGSGALPASIEPWAWSTLALARARELSPRTPSGRGALARTWDGSDIDRLLAERMDAWERRWSTTDDGQPWDAEQLAGHLPWLLTARIVSLAQPAVLPDERFLDAHPELPHTDFSGADAETLCWLAWLAGECDPARYPGWRERLRGDLEPRLMERIRAGGDREASLAIMAWASLQLR